MDYTVRRLNNFLPELHFSETDIVHAHRIRNTKIVKVNKPRNIIIKFLSEQKFFEAKFISYSSYLSIRDIHREKIILSQAGGGI